MRWAVPALLGATVVIALLAAGILASLRARPDDAAVASPGAPPAPSLLSTAPPTSTTPTTTSIQSTTASTTTSPPTTVVTPPTPRPGILPVAPGGIDPDLPEARVWDRTPAPAYSYPGRSDPTVWYPAGYGLRLVCQVEGPSVLDSEETAWYQVAPPNEPRYVYGGVLTVTDPEAVPLCSK